MHRQRHKRKNKKIVLDKNFHSRKEWFDLLRIIQGLFLLLLIIAYFLVNLYFKNIETLKNSEAIPLISDALLAFISALVLNLLINTNYNRHFKDGLYEIITNSRLIETYVKQKRKEEIMRAAMNANLGSDITAALYGNIFDNYLHTYNTILRQNFQFNIHLASCDMAEFYHANMQILFQLPKHKKPFQLKILACHDSSEIPKHMENVSGLNRQLVFPLVLASEIDRIEGQNRFNINVTLDGEQIIPPTCKNEIEMKLPPNHENSFVKIDIETFLNKNENFFQEDIFSIHKGYSLTLCYESGLLKNCHCYHSCKSKELVTIQTENSIHISTSGILLPENNFVFIWEKNNE